MEDNVLNRKKRLSSQDPLHSTIYIEDKENIPAGLSLQSQNKTRAIAASRRSLQKEAALEHYNHYQQQ